MLIAGLPLQNLHAVAMPFCASGQETTAAHAHPAQDGSHRAQADARVSADAGSAAEQDRADHQHASADTGNACDGCSQCQACSAPALASVAIDVMLDIVQTPPLTFAIHPSLFTPEQLQRPPSQFLA